MFNRSKRNLKNKKGFTLIELVVVIAVIGILAAIAIPRVTGITSKAKQQSAKQHIAILNSAAARYEADHGSKLTGSSASDAINTLESGGYLSSDTKSSIEKGTLKFEDGFFNDGSETTPSGGNDGSGGSDGSSGSDGSGGTTPSNP